MAKNKNNIIIFWIEGANIPLYGTKWYWFAMICHLHHIVHGAQLGHKW
jgi:hypothetical protein